MSLSQALNQFAQNLGRYRLVFANPEDGVAYEPSALLSYDKFIANIVMALGVHRA